MNRNELIKLAREAGFESNSLGVTYTSGCLPDLLERFATLIAQAENESCVEALRKEYMTGSKPTFLRDLEKAIRARGQE